MNIKLLPAFLGVVFNFYVNLNSVGLGSPRSPRKPSFGIDIDERIETAKKDMPLDPLTLNIQPQSSPASPRSTFDELEQRSFNDKSFSERMAERAKVNKTAERLNAALTEGAKQRQEESVLPNVTEPLLPRSTESFYFAGNGAAPQVNKNLLDNKTSVDDWWGPVVDPRESNQVDQLRKLKQDAAKVDDRAPRIDQTPGPLTRNSSLDGLPETELVRAEAVVTVGRDGQTSGGPLARNPIPSPMKEDFAKKDSGAAFDALIGISSFLNKQENLSVQTDLAGEKSQGSSDKKSSSKPKKKKVTPAKSVKTENFGQAFLGKFNEEFGLQGGKTYGNAIEVARRMATKDQFVETKESVIDARKQFNAANKVLAENILKSSFVWMLPSDDQKLLDKKNFNEEESKKLYQLAQTNNIDVNSVDQAKKTLDIVVKKETEAYLQEAKDAFIESSPDVANVKKTEKKLLEKAFAKMRGEKNLSQNKVDELSKKEVLADDDRIFISGFLDPDDKLAFDGLKKAFDDARSESSRKLNNLLSFIPPETNIDPVAVLGMITNNVNRASVYGDFVLKKKQGKKTESPNSQQLYSGRSSFNSENDALGDDYLKTPKALVSVPESTNLDSSKTLTQKSMREKSSFTKKAGSNFEKKDDAEVLKMYEDIAKKEQTIKKARTLLNSKENELVYAVKAMLEPKGSSRTDSEMVDNVDLNGFLTKKQNGQDLSEE